MNLELALVETLEQAQQMRMLRNECAEWMTGNTDEISEAQQEEFFREKIATGEVKALLIYAESIPAAYALVRPDHMMSCGAGAQYRGLGLGKLIVAVVTNLGFEEYGQVLLEVRADNIRARRVYEKVGYRLIGSAEHNGVPVDLMEYP